MKTIEQVCVSMVAIALAVIALILTTPTTAVHAQNGGMIFASTATVAGCKAPNPPLSLTGNIAQICGAPDGIYISTVNNPTPVMIASALPSGAVLTVNHKAPDATGNVSLTAVASAAAPTTTATTSAPAVTVTLQ